MASRPLPPFIAPDLLARLKARVEALPIFSNLGLVLTDLGPGWARLEVPAIPATVNLEGMVSGGILATAADVACGVALATAFDGEMPFSTADLHIRYLEPAVGAVTAEGRVVRLSGRSGVMECRLTIQGGLLVGLATCQFAIVNRRKA